MTEPVTMDTFDICGPLPTGTTLLEASAEWVTPRFNETGFPKEDGDQWHVRAWGEQAPYDLLAAPLLADEAHDGPAPHRLGHYALRVWSPLLATELVRGI